MDNEDTKREEDENQDEMNAGEGEGDQEVDADAEDPDAEGEEEVPVYIEKDFVAKPYNSEFVEETTQEVEKSKVINSRKPIKVRVSRRREEFHAEGLNFIEREPGDQPLELKQKKIGLLIQNKMVLDIGLQAARQIKTFSSQTYHNRSVNLSVEYNPKDFLSNMPNIDKNNNEEMNKMEKFFEKVAPRIEEALQSNELINVFQDDFEMLGDKKTKSTAVSNQQSEPLPFSDIDHGKNKSVSCVAFHPSKKHIVAMSFLENISFDERAEISGKSYDSSVLIINFADHHVMLHSVLHTTIEIKCIEFHPEKESLLFGGCLSGQIMVWDSSDESTKITSEDDNITLESEEKKEEVDDGQDKSTQTVTEYKAACISMVAYSHKTHVNDMKFIPYGVRVNKKAVVEEGFSSHFISCAEDGYVLIWDCTPILKENRNKNIEEIAWKPFLNIPLFRPDGSGEQGLSKILFQKQ